MFSGNTCDPIMSLGKQHGAAGSAIDSNARSQAVLHGINKAVAAWFHY
jgi:hypothetical protein